MIRPYSGAPSVNSLLSPINMSTCAPENTVAKNESAFWNSNGVNWDQHRIGWAIAGACACVTVIITMVSVLRHCRDYTNRREQRQIIRILYMPLVYAVISFFSYRFFRNYTYYSFIEAAYEAVTLSAFLLLLIEFVAATTSGHHAEDAIARKDKRPLPIPFCCWRYRPTKPYFMYTVKWCVLQYVIIRPLVSIVGIICQKYNVLCETAGFNTHFANVYLESVNFASISIALYGLLMFYGLTAEELKGRRPLAKFLAIKLIVMFTFYQSFVFSALERRVLHATQYWTVTNIANGLNALAICIEMVPFSVFMMWAYSPTEYIKAGETATSIWRPLWDSINYIDFAQEILGSLHFFVNYARGKPHTRHGDQQKMNFGEAFGVSSPPRDAPHVIKTVSLDLGGSELASRPPTFRQSQDERGPLAP